jgi:hypothetical protein
LLECLRWALWENRDRRPGFWALTRHSVLVMHTVWSESAQISKVIHPTIEIGYRLDVAGVLVVAWSSIGSII